MLLSQYLNDAGRPQVAVRDEGEARAVQSEATLYQIALDAIAAGASLRDHVNALGTGDVVDLSRWWPKAGCCHR